MSSITVRRQNGDKPAIGQSQVPATQWDPWRQMRALLEWDVPGIQDKDLEVTITGNRLTVAGKREEEKEEKSDRYYTYERNYGSFSRSFTLPEGADTEKLPASLEKGVLTVTLPKKPEVQPKQIAVKSEAQTVKS